MLDGKSGVSLVPRAALADVIQKVNYTTCRTAVLIPEPPESVGLKGFPRQRVVCQLSVMTNKGNRDTVSVERFLVQISYGEPVRQLFEGQKTQLYTSMVLWLQNAPPDTGGLKDHCQSVFSAARSSSTCRSQRLRTYSRARISHVPSCCTYNKRNRCSRLRGKMDSSLSRRRTTLIKNWSCCGCPMVLL